MARPTAPMAKLKCCRLETVSYIMLTRDMKKMKKILGRHLHYDMRVFQMLIYLKVH